MIKEKKLKDPKLFEFFIGVMIWGVIIVAFIILPFLLGKNSISAFDGDPWDMPDNLDHILAWFIGASKLGAILVGGYYLIKSINWIMKDLKNKKESKICDFFEGTYTFFQKTGTAIKDKVVNTYTKTENKIAKKIDKKADPKKEEVFCEV